MRKQQFSQRQISYRNRDHSAKRAHFRPFAETHNFFGHPTTASTAKMKASSVDEGFVWRRWESTGCRFQQIRDRSIRAANVTVSVKRERTTTEIFRLWRHRDQRTSLASAFTISTSGVVLKLSTFGRKSVGKLEALVFVLAAREFIENIQIFFENYFELLNRNCT